MDLYMYIFSNEKQKYKRVRRKEKQKCDNALCKTNV